MSSNVNGGYASESSGWEPWTRGDQRGVPGRNSANESGRRPVNSAAHQPMKNTKAAPICTKYSTIACGMIISQRKKMVTRDCGADGAKPTWIGSRPWNWPPCAGTPGGGGMAGVYVTLLLLAGDDAMPGGGVGRADQPCGPWTAAGALLTLDCMISQPRYPRAPIDQAGLAQALMPFGQSRMLPPGAYT